MRFTRKSRLKKKRHVRLERNRRNNHIISILQLQLLHHERNHLWTFKALSRIKDRIFSEAAQAKLTISVCKSEKITIQFHLLQQIILRINLARLRIIMPIRMRLRRWNRVIIIIIIVKFEKASNTIITITMRARFTRRQQQLRRLIRNWRNIRSSKTITRNMWRIESNKKY